MLETASFHIVKPCNMSCKFCYATFNDMDLKNQILLSDVFVILDKLKEGGLQKITFAGGEPMLYKHLPEALFYAKKIGLTTGIITNGSLLNERFLIKNKLNLDWIGLSVDSLDQLTNFKIGRIGTKLIDYEYLVRIINMYNYKLKINTVVNIHNENESLQNFINKANPDRWKIFDTLRVEGQNDQQFEAIKTSTNGFKNFIANHSHPSMVVENNEAMTGSYLLIDPQGRLFENSSGKHTYSQPLQKYNLIDCLSEINLNREMFIHRGGIYNW